MKLSRRQQGKLRVPSIFLCFRGPTELNGEGTEEEEGEWKPEREVPYQLLCSNPLSCSVTPKAGALKVGGLVGIRIGKLHKARRLNKESPLFSCETKERRLPDKCPAFGLSESCFCH